MQVNRVMAYQNNQQSVAKNSNKFAQTNLLSKQEFDSLELNNSKKKDVSFEGVKGFVKGALGLAEFSAGGLGFVGALFTPAAPVAILAGAASLAGLILGAKNTIEASDGDDDFQIEKLS